MQWIGAIVQPIIEPVFYKLDDFVIFKQIIVEYSTKHTIFATKMLFV